MRFSESQEYLVEHVKLLLFIIYVLIYYLFGTVLGVQDVNCWVHASALSYYSTCIYWSTMLMQVQQYTKAKKNGSNLEWQPNVTFT